MAESAALTFAMLLLCLCGPAASDQLAKCAKPELSSCYCGKTTYDRQELYAVNCTGTGLDAQKSMDVFMNLPNETEVSRNGVLREKKTKGIAIYRSYGGRGSIACLRGGWSVSLTILTIT